MLENQIAVLSIIQGLTEFLPISSSGHLALAPYFFNWPDQGLIIDVAMHVGSLFAVIVYFYKDTLDLFKGAVLTIMFQRKPQSRLFTIVIVASIPLVCVGYFASYIGFMDIIRAPEIAILVIGSTTLGFGILLWLVDSFSITVKQISHLTISNAFLLGLAQCFAIIPGTSRAGVCISAARFLGMERKEATRISMLLSIIAITAAGTFKAYELFNKSDSFIIWQDTIWSICLAFVASFISIWFLMEWCEK